MKVLNVYPEVGILIVDLRLKWIDTRSRNTRHRGAIAIYATKRDADSPAARRDPWHDAVMNHLPNEGIIPPERRGHIIGSAKLADCVPIVELDTDDRGYPPKRIEVSDEPGLWLVDETLPEDPDAADLGQSFDRLDQLPYGDFTPGRVALLLEDVQPVEERCPECWTGPGSGHIINENGYISLCPTCIGKGHTDPIPAKGKQGLWEWTP